MRRRAPHRPLPRLRGRDREGGKREREHPAALAFASSAHALAARLDRCEKCECRSPKGERAQQSSPSLLHSRITMQIITQSNRRDLRFSGGQGKDRSGHLAARPPGAISMKDTLRPGMSLVNRVAVDRERTIAFMGEEARVYATPDRKSVV